MVLPRFAHGGFTVKSHSAAGRTARRPPGRGSRVRAVDHSHPLAEYIDKWRLIGESCSVFRG